MAERLALFDRVAVRHRAPGHLRLQLPAELCREAVARYLCRGLERLPGVRRVVLDPPTGKLAIHYQALEVNDRRIAVHLAKLLEALLERPAAQEAAPAPAPKPLAALRARLLEVGPLRGVQERFSLWRARAVAAKVLIGHEMENRPALQVFGKDPETAAINFINEIVTFYLIKLHWNQIAQLWLRQPFRYYKEWLSLVYLVFLLVRSRRSGSSDKRPGFPSS